MKLMEIYQARYGEAIPATVQPENGTYATLLNTAVSNAMDNRAWASEYAEKICRHGVVTKVAHSRMSNEERERDFYAEKPTYALWLKLCQVAIEMHREIGGMENYVPSA